MKHTKNIFLISSLILTILNAHVGSPTAFKVSQPDGEEIKLHIKGDHLHNWHDYNGWTAVKDRDGWWVYALGNDGKTLIPSQIKVGATANPDEINPSIIKGIKPLYEKHLNFLISQGFSASYTSINPKGLYRVAYARLDSRNKAARLISEIRSTGVDTWLLIEK